MRDLAMTKKDAARVHRWLRKWQRRCFLQAWRFDVEFCDESHSETGDERIFYATVDPDPPYLTLHLFVYPEFWELAFDEQERRLLHELMHGPVTPLALLALRAVRRKQAIRKDVETTEEQLVEWITNVLWASR